MRWFNSITASMDVNLSNLREIEEDKGAWRSAVYGVKKSRTRLNNYKIGCMIGIGCRCCGLFSREEKHTLLPITVSTPPI